MYIVAIAWLYVVFMMSITEQTVTAGVATFLLYGVFPLTIVLYLMGAPQRKRNRQNKVKMQAALQQQQSKEDAKKCEPESAPEQSESTTRQG